MARARRGPKGRSPGGRGLLVAIEGIDGAGKSRLQQGLARRLKALGYRVALWKEPSDTELGQAARRAGAGDPRRTALLFTLDRSAMRERLRSRLERCDIVLSDRSFYSTLAYQGSALPAGERRDLETIQLVVARVPDLVLWLDLPVAEALARVDERGKGRSSLEVSKVLTRTRAAYARYARREPERLLRLDARDEPETVLEQALATVVGSLPRPPRAARR